MILFDHVSYEYEKGIRALDDVSFAIEKGESVGLIGANGAGKSTLLKGMLGLVSCGGKIVVDNLPVTGANLKQIRKKLGYVLQNSDNQMFMPTVYEDILFGPVNYGMSRETAMQKADEVLERLEISSLKHRRNHRISGGEKKMTAIAAVLAMEPEVILMDEPGSSLDPYNRRQIIRVINELTCTKIIASHDLDLILDTCTRVLLLSGGKLAAEGETRKILTDRALLESHRLELPLSLSGTF